MLREGPIPRFLHGLIEYVAAGVFIAAPFVLSFESSAAVAASIVIGVVLLFVAAATEGPTGLINYIPVAAHVVLDFILAGLLIAMPFILGFSGESTPTAFFIVIGALHLLITIGTRFKKDVPTPERAPEPEPEPTATEAEPAPEREPEADPAELEPGEFDWPDERSRDLEQPPEHEPPPEPAPGERS